MASETGCLTLRVQFGALHELKNNSLSVEENKKVFGKCYNLHGHTYILDVTIYGEIDKDSGLCCDRDLLKKIVETEVLKFNGQHLNYFFKSTTGEDLVKEFHNILKNALKPMKLYGVRLSETPKNSFYLSDYQSLFY